MNIDHTNLLEVLKRKPSDAEKIETGNELHGGLTKDK